MELGGAGNLRIVRFHSRFGIRRARGRYRYCFGAQLFQQGTKAELAIERRKSTDIWLAERKRWKIDLKRDMRAYLGEFFAQKDKLPVFLKSVAIACSFNFPRSS